MVDITAQHMVPTVREFSEVRESQGKSGKMERVNEKSGNFKKYHIAKVKNLFKNNKKSHTFTVITLIIYTRYSVHAIHTLLRSETVWYQPLCMKHCFMQQLL